MFGLTVWLNHLVEAMKEQDTTTQGRIVEAARDVFLQQGFDGARMQEIADRAGINKAMLHYYFRSKKQLFDVVFTETLGMFHQMFQEVLLSDATFVEKLRMMIEKDMTVLMDHPDIPLFVISEVARNPEQMSERARGAHLSGLIEEFSRQVRSAIRKKQIRRVDPFDLLINLLSLNRFPFVAGPMLRSLAGMDEKKFLKLIQRRKKTVADLLIGDLTRNLPGNQNA